MNLRGIANRATRRVNPNIPAQLLRSTGYGVGADYSQVPTYAAPVDISAQVQALTQSELEHLNALNISNGQASIFVDTQLSSADRPGQSGGDLIEFGTGRDVPPDLQGQTWLVVALLEGWSASGWCKAAITSQMP